MFHLHHCITTEFLQTLEVIDETVYHHVLDIILTHLPKEHHKSFLERLTKTLPMIKQS